MKKYSILSILPILVMTIAVLAPTPTSAEVACPTGYTCTPIGCPTGYICTPISSSSNASNTASLTNALSALTLATTANANATNAANNSASQSTAYTTGIRITDAMIGELGGFARGIAGGLLLDSRIARN